MGSGAGGIIDVHANLLPDWDWENVQDWFAEESASLRRAFSHPKAQMLNRQANVDHLLGEMDRCGISRAICFSYQWNSAARCDAATQNIAEIMASHADRLRGLAVVQPREADAALRLEGWLDMPGMIGLKVKPKWGGFSLADLSVMGPICEVLTARRGVLLTHISQNFQASEGDNLCDLVTLIKSFPDLKVVAAHMGAFADVYAMYDPVGRLFKNVRFDISLPANLAWLPHLMRLGARERYLFATDFPYISFDEMIAALDKVGLSEDEMDDLLCKNAEAFMTDIQGW